MFLRLFYAYGVVLLLGAALFLALLLIGFVLASIRGWVRGKPNTFRSGLCTGCIALGLAFLQIVSIFYQPPVACVLELKQERDAEEDDSGDPDSPEAKRNHFLAQLRRIRMGLPIRRLVWRL